MCSVSRVGQSGAMEPPRGSGGSPKPEYTAAPSAERCDGQAIPVPCGPSPVAIKVRDPRVAGAASLCGGPGRRDGDPSGRETPRPSPTILARPGQGRSRQRSTTSAGPARALIHDPRVLFLDEPTANLDPQAAKTVRDSLLVLRRDNRTVLLNTRHLREADHLCDRVGVLNTALIAVGRPNR